MNTNKHSRRLGLGLAILCGSALARAGDVDVKLTTTDGSTKFTVQDSNSVEVSSVTSQGDAAFESVTLTGGSLKFSDGTIATSSPTVTNLGAVPTSRTVSTASPLTGGGALSGNLTLGIGSNLPGGSTSYVQDRDTLQSGTTFYVSSGTVTDLNVTNLKFNDGTTQTTAGGGGGVAPRAYVGHWGALNLTTSQNNLQMTFDVAGANQIAAGSRIKVPYAGIIRGICVSGSAARTGGTATFQVFKNGADIGSSSDAVIDGTNTQFHCSTAGTGTVAAQDIIDVRVTTTSTWAPTTAEWTAEIVYEMTE